MFSFFSQPKKIVCIGGGGAMPRAVLSELKKSPHYLAVVSAVLDSGGSAGKLRNDYHTISFGDIRRALLELMTLSDENKEYFSYRFKGGELDGHVLINVMLSALYLQKENYRIFFERINDLLGERHSILPATITDSHLHAILENGEEIKGETNIDIPKHDSDLRIKNIYLVPEAKPCPVTLRNLDEADIIIIGPGDLYSSLLQTLLINGMGEAIIKSSAKKVFICNLMTKKGESNNYSVQDFTNEIERYLRGPVDYVIFNNAIPDNDRISDYHAKHPELLEPVRVDEGLDDKKFIGADLLESEGGIVHDPKKLNKIILNLI
jgi:uncharacterized cofD-like protein